MQNLPREMSWIEVANAFPHFFPQHPLSSVTTVDTVNHDFLTLKVALEPFSTQPFVKLWQTIHAGAWIENFLPILVSRDSSSRQWKIPVKYSYNK